jgi:hypothetical protein
MPAERVIMRRVREILRYRFEDGLGHKAISYRVGAAPSTVRETLRRAAAAGLRNECADCQRGGLSSHSAPRRSEWLALPSCADRKGVPSTF